MICRPTAAPPTNRRSMPPSAHQTPWDGPWRLLRHFPPAVCPIEAFRRPQRPIRPPPRLIDDRRMTWIIATALALSVSLGLAAHAAGAGSQAPILALVFLALSAITLLLLKRFLEG